MFVDKIRQKLVTEVVLNNKISHIYLPTRHDIRKSPGFLYYLENGMIRFGRASLFIDIISLSIIFTCKSVIPISMAWRWNQNLQSSNSRIHLYHFSHFLWEAQPVEIQRCDQEMLKKILLLLQQLLHILQDPEAWRTYETKHE